MTSQDILTKQIVLLTNRNWQALCTKTPAEAFAMLAADVATAIDVGEDGSMTPVTWEQWIDLPIRDYDNVIHTSKRVIRIPTVIISCSYDKVPLKAPKFSGEGVKVRDHYTCQYCGNEFKSSSLNLDHVIPRSRYGQTIWENVVASCYKCNGKKGARLPEEAKMYPKKSPKAPRSLPPSKRIKNVHKIADWDVFLN